MTITASEPPSTAPPASGRGLRAVGRKTPRSHSTSLVLMELSIALPAGMSEAALAEAASAVARALDRCMRAIEATGARCLGVADLTPLFCWTPTEEWGAHTAMQALDAAGTLARDLRASGLDAQPRVAIVSGSGVIGTFGGLGGHWLEIASGAIAKRLERAVGICQPGEAVLSMELWPTGRPRTELVPRRDGLVSLPLPRPDLDEVDRCEAPSVEPRPCSVVALEICGADLERGDYAGRLHRAVRSLQRVARLHGGSLLALRHDHRGLFGLVLFDAAGGGGGRAAVRALRFGQELGQSLAELGLDAPAGVASGSLTAWSTSDAWAVCGPALERAVGLARATVSELLCDLSCATLARSRAELSAVSAKVADEPSFAVEHVAPSRSRRWSTASGTVGRREELARIDQIASELMVGTAGVLMVEGTQGQGKSRMVDELVARLRNERCRVVVAYGVPGASASPLAPWRSVVAQLLRLEEPVEPHRFRERLVEVLGDRVDDEVLEALGSALPLGQRSSAPTLAGARVLLETLAALIVALQGDTPMMVVIEDAQWLDSASWSLARELAASAEQLLLVVALRTERHELSLEAQRLAAMPETTVMVLRGLSVEELPKLVRHELGLRGLPSELQHWLRSTTDGNPRLCIEWLRLLQDEGALRSEEGRVVQAPSPSELAARQLVGLPDLLRRRVALLGEGVRRTLAVCTATGGLFETELLVEVHPDRPGMLRVEADLEHLATAGLLQPAPGRSDRAWMVTHVAVEDAARGALSAQDMVGLHAAIASWYEQREDDLAPRYPSLALHWLEAGKVDKAMRYLELAGSQAMRSGAMPEAVRHYQQALRLAAGSVQGAEVVGALRRAHWERSLGDARYACGDLERCGVHYERALVLLGERLPRGRVQLVLHAAWQILRQSLHRVLPSQAVEVPAERHLELFEASHAAERLAERYYYSADPVALCSSSVLSANLADRMGRRARNARPYASMSYLIGLLKHPGLSERVYQHALHIAEEAPDPAGLAVALYTRATYHAGRSEWDQARGLVDRGLEAAERAGAWQEAGVAQTMRAMVHYYMGELGYAEACYGELLGTARERYNAQHEAWALYGIGQCQGRRGRLVEAARSVQQGLAVLGNIDDYPSRLICHGMQAGILAQLGQLEAARESAELAWLRARRVVLPFVLPTLEGYAGMTRAYLCLTRSATVSSSERRELMRRAVASVRQLSRFAWIFPTGRARYQLARGELALIRGRPDAAEQAWRLARGDAASLGQPFEGAVASASLAELEPADAQELRRDASRAFERMGCAWRSRCGWVQQGQSQ